MAGDSLSVTSGHTPGASIGLNGDELVLGRSTPGLAALGADTELSRVHARVWRGPGGALMIEDLGSRNGTWVNGERIDGPRELRHGDRVRAGRTTMELAAGAPASDANGAPTYDALVEEEAPAAAESRRYRPLWPAVAIAALLAGGSGGALIAGSSGRSGGPRTVTVTRADVRPPAAPRIAAPPGVVQLPAAPATGASSPAPAEFSRAFCGRGATAARGTCTCVYDELLRREPYAQLAAQVAASHRGRISPAIRRAARACGAAA